MGREHTESRSVLVLAKRPAEKGGDAWEARQLIDQSDRDKLKITLEKEEGKWKKRRLFGF